MFFNLRSIYSQKHIRMKKFILHGNRCIVVTRFFNLDFARHIKGRYPWNEVAEQKNFLSQQASFSASDRLGRNFPTVQNSPEKRKNFYLIKLVSK